MKHVVKKIFSIAWFCIKILFCIVICFILLGLAMDYVYHYKCCHLSEINVTSIGDRERISMTIPVRRIASPPNFESRGIIFNAEEGSFTFRLNKDMTDFTINAYRMGNFVVAIPCYEVTSEDDKAKLLPIIKRAYEIRKKREQETYEFVYGKKEEQTIDVRNDKEVATP